VSDIIDCSGNSEINDDVGLMADGSEVSDTTVVSSSLIKSEKSPLPSPDPLKTSDGIGVGEIKFEVMDVRKLSSAEEIEDDGKMLSPLPPPIEVGVGVTVGTMN